jgi:hypothetical protein
MPRRKNEQASFWIQMRTAERNIIGFTLENTTSIRKAAAILGVSSNFLSRRVRLLGISVPGLKLKPEKPKKKKRVPAPSSPPTLSIVQGDTPIVPVRERTAQVLPTLFAENNSIGLAAEPEEEDDEDFDDEDDDDEDDYEDEDDEDDEDDDEDEDDENGTEETGAN